MTENELLGRAIVLAVVGIGGLAVVVWGGAWLAAFVVGGDFRAGIADGVGAGFNLPGNLVHPAEAWPERLQTGLPDAAVYWPATVLVAGLVAATAVAGVWCWQRVQHVGTADRQRLGVPARAWFAKRSDLAPLLVEGPRRGRFVVGTLRGQRGALVATECRATSEVSLKKAVRERQGDTGAVALVGPTRSGKTVAAVAGILEWEGPAILSSVKTDLMASTIGWRAQRGDVRVYDPLGLTSVVGHGWSPLAAAKTTTGARRAARNLLEAIANDGTENLGMWKNLAEYLTAGLFWVAANTGRDMATVLEWVLTQDRPRPDMSSELEDLLRELLASPDPEVAADAPTVLNWLLSTWEQDERPRSSIYVTAQAALSAFADPAVSGRR